MPSISRGVHRWLFQGGAALDDLSDRLNHVWTVGLLLMLGAIISWKHGYSEPVTCWCPAEFKDAMVTYTNRICWHSNIMAQTPEMEMPLVTEMESYVERVDPSTNETYVDFMVPGLTERLVPEDFQTTLYQWVPLILCLQALLFKLPNILMYIFHGYSGLSFDKIQSLTSGFESLTMEDRLLLGRQTAQYIQTWLNGRLVKLPWRTFTVVWFVVKLCYVINVITQVALVDKFLSTKEIDNATSYGELIYDNFQEDNITLYRETPVFPRQVQCHFRMRMLSNIQQWQVTCALPGNIFAEYAYMFLWVWLVFVALVTTVSMVVWLLRRVVPLFKRRYIRQFLDMSPNAQSAEVAPYLGLEEFSDSYLGEDGMFVLKLIGSNSSDLLVKDVVNHLWTMSRDSHRPSGVVVAPAIQSAPDGGVEMTPLYPVLEAPAAEADGTDDLKKE